MNIAGKRKALYNQIRSQHLEQIFTDFRKKMINTFQEASKQEIQELLLKVPSTLHLINQRVPLQEGLKSIIIELLIDKCEYWVGRCKQNLISLVDWCEGLEILIKILSYCEDPSKKGKIVQVSEDVFLSKYYWIVESNKMLKHDLLMLMLHYYIASVKWPTFLPFLSKYQKTMVRQLSGINLRSKPKQFTKFIYFLSVLLERASEVDYFQLINQIFIQDNSVILKLTKTLQEIYYHKTEETEQVLICTILKMFINLTYSIRDDKLTKIFMLSSFKEFIVERLNAHHQGVGKEYFLQFTCNLMVDQPSFRDFIRKSIDIQVLDAQNEHCLSLVQDIKELCWP